MEEMLLELIQLLLIILHLRDLTIDDFETNLGVIDPTEDRTINLANEHLDMTVRNHQLLH